jgi:hypothetical protein
MQSHLNPLSEIGSWLVPKLGVKSSGSRNKIHSQPQTKSLLLQLFYIVICSHRSDNGGGGMWQAQASTAMAKISGTPLTTHNKGYELMNSVKF